MKRRLNILCLVVMLVLSYSVLEQGYYIFLGAKMGAQTGLELGKKGSDIAAYKELMNLKVVNLIPSSMESFVSSGIPSTMRKAGVMCLQPTLR